MAGTEARPTKKWLVGRPSLAALILLIPGLVSFPFSPFNHFPFYP
jgi:hypothetical protein